MYLPPEVRLTSRNTDSPEAMVWIAPKNVAGKAFRSGRPR
jgi:hypothetical protein